jgi:hypothetical protein
VDAGSYGIRVLCPRVYGDNDVPGVHQHAGGLGSSNGWIGCRIILISSLFVLGSAGLSGVGREYHLAPHAPHSGPQRSLVWIQHHHSRAAYQYRIWLYNLLADRY